MSDSNFERSGIILELQGIKKYLEQLAEMQAEQNKVAESAQALTTSLNGLDTLAMKVFGNINKIEINTKNLGFVKVGDDAEKATGKVEDFAEELTEGAKALKKVQDMADQLKVFNDIAKVLATTTQQLQTGFNAVQDAIKLIDLDRLARDAEKTATNIGQLADSFNKLDMSLGGNLLNNLDRLIPILQAAGALGKIGNVGESIQRLFKGFSAIGKLPEITGKQEDFLTIVIFLERIAQINIPASIGVALAELGDGLTKLKPGLKDIASINLSKDTVTNIFGILTTFKDYIDIDVSRLIALSTGIEKLAVAFRTFTSGKAGENFAKTNVLIASAVGQLLDSLYVFLTYSDIDKVITNISKLGLALRDFAHGASALGRDFNNTFANVGKSTEIVIDAITKLRNALSTFTDINNFTKALTTISSGFLALSKAFQSFGRATSIRNVETQVDQIIRSILKLSQADILNAAKKINALSKPIKDLGTALRFLKKEGGLSESFVNRTRELGLNFGLMGTATRLLAQSLLFLGTAARDGLVALSKFTFNATITGITNLLNAIKTLILFLVRIPINAVIIGIKALGIAFNLITVPIRALITLIAKLGDMFGKVFTRSSSNLSDSLGLDTAQGEVSEFEKRMDKLQTSLRSSNEASKSAAKGVHDFGSAANDASGDVQRLDKNVDQLGDRTSTLGKIFGGADLLRVAGTFKAVDVAVDLVTDSIYNLTYGFTSLLKEGITATSQFEQLNLQLTALQAKEQVKAGAFPDVPTALTEGTALLQSNVKDLISEFRILAIQSPFETKDVANAFRLAQAFGFTTAQGKELVRTLVDAGSALGFTGADLTEVTRVFGQIRTTGKLMAQDMNQLAARGIGVKQIISDLVGGTVDWDNVTVDANQAITAITRSLQADFAGAAARSASSIEGLMGSFRSFKEEALRTFLQPIVEGLRPIFVGLADTLFVPEVFDKIEAAGLKAFAIIENIAITAASIAGVITNLFNQVPKPVLDFLILLGKAAGIAIAATTALIGLQFAIGVVVAALSFAASPLGIVAAITFTVHEGVVAATEGFLSFGNMLEYVGNILGSIFAGQALEDFNANISRLPDSLEPGIRALAELTQWVGNAYRVVQQLGDIFVQAFNLNELPIASAIESLDSSLRPIATTIANVGTAFGRFYNYIATIAQNIYTTVSNAFYNLGTTINDTFVGIVNGSNSIVGSLFTTAQNVSNYLSSLIEQVGDFGVGVVEAFAAGMSGAVNLVVDAVGAIADAIIWLLAPGSPPRAIPDIDKYGESAGQQFVDGISNANTDTIATLASNIETQLGNISVPDNVDLGTFFESMQWSENESGQIVDGLGNIVLTQQQLADASRNAADELQRVNDELAALDKQASIDKQQNTVDRIKQALKQPGISDSARKVLEQQLKRAELELRRLQLQAEEDGVDTGGGGLGGGKSGGSGKTKGSKDKEPKDVKEPDQKIPKDAKAKKVKAKKTKDALDLDVPDTSKFENAFGDPDSNTGLLGRITEAFNNAKENITTSIGGIRENIISVFTDLRDRFKPLIDQILAIIADFQRGFADGMDKKVTVPNIGEFIVEGPSLAEAIMGFDATEFAESSGILVGAIVQEIQNIRGQFDIAISDAFNAQEIGENPVLAFLNNFFDATKIAETITTELTGLGTLIAASFTGELAKALNGEQQAFYDASIGSWTVEAPTGDSFIAKFVLDQIKKAKDELSAIDWQGEFDAIATDVKEGIGSLFNIDVSTDSEGAKTIFGGLQAIIDGYFNLLRIINEQIEKQKDNGKIGEFVDDLKRLIIAIDDLLVTGGSVQEIFNNARTKTPGGTAGTGGGAANNNQGAPFIIAIITGITSIFYAVAAIPSISASAIQTVDESIRAVGNLVLLISGINAKDGTATMTALENLMKNIGGVFTNIGGIRQEVTEIIGNTVTSLANMLTTIAGVKNPAGLEKTTQTITRMLDQFVTSMLTIKIAEFLKVAPGYTGLILALQLLTVGLAGLNESGDLTGVIDTLNAVTLLMSATGIAVSISTGLGGAKAATLIMPFISQFISSVVALAGGPAAALALKTFRATTFSNLVAFLKQGLTPLLATVKTFLTSAIDGSLITKFTTLFRTIMTSLGNISLSIGEFLVGGASAANATAIAGVITALSLAVVSIIGAFIAFQKDIGGFKTELVLPQFEAEMNLLTGILEAFQLFFNDGLSLDSEGATARAEANVKFIEAFGRFWDSFVSILDKHDGSFVQTVADTFAGAMGGVIDLFNSMMGTDFETDLTGRTNPLLDFLKGVEDFIVQLFTTIGAIADFENTNTTLGKIESVLDSISAFANIMNGGEDVDLKSLGPVEAILDFLQKFTDFFKLDVDLTAMDRVIVSVLSLTDALGFLGNMNLDRIGAAARIMALLVETIFNPSKAIVNVPSIAAIIANVTSSVDSETPKLESSVDKYLQALGKVEAPRVIEPPVTIKPLVEFDFDTDNPFQNRDDTGWFTPETFGGTSDGFELPIKVIPTFDNEALKSSGTFGQEVVAQITGVTESVTAVSAAAQTDVTNSFTTMNTNVTTQTAALKTTVDSSFLSVAGSIIKGAADGALGFITELGLIPDKTTEPKDKIVEKLDGYGTDFNTSGNTLGVAFGDGFIIGIESKQTEVENAARNLGAIANLAVRNVIQSASPAKTMIKEGENFSQGLPIGFKKGERAVGQGAAGLAKHALKMVSSTLTDGIPAIQKILGGIFGEKGALIDFSKWKLISDSETDVSKRAEESATNIAEQFGNSFARVTNQIFDELIGIDPSLAPNFFNSDAINESFTKEMDAIFKHRDDTLAQLTDEGKAQFDRNFLAAFTAPEGLKTIAEDFVNQFSDDDLENLPKVFGAVDKFVNGLRSRFEAAAQGGDGFAMSMIGGLDDLRAALDAAVQASVDELANNGEDTAEGATSVGTAISDSIVSGTSSPEALGGLNTAVTTLTQTLVSTITTEFAKITAIVTGQGEASSQGFITGVNIINSLLPASKDTIITTFSGFAEEFAKSGAELGDDWSTGYAAGMITEEALKAVYDAAFKVGQTAKQGTADGQNSASPSKIAMDLGIDFVDGYVIGITSSLNDVTDASYELAQAANAALANGLTTTAPIITKTLEGAIKQGTFWIDENIKFEEPVDSGAVDDATESMNALERATETAKGIFDSFGESFNSTFDSVFDKFFEMNPDAIADIWDIGPIRDAATSIAEELRSTLDAIGEELSPSGRGKFSDLIKQMFGDEDTIKTLVTSFIDSFSPEELAALPDASKAIETFVRQIQDVFLEDDDYEGFLKEMGLTDDLVGGFTGITEKLKKEIQAALDAIKEEENPTPVKDQWILDNFGDYELPAKELGENLTLGIAAGITSPVATTALSTAAQTAIDLFMNELRNAGDIHSPSKLTMRLAGEPLVDGIVVGMKNRIPNMLKTARIIGDTAAHSFGSADWLRQNTFDQKVNLKYNGMVDSLPELFQSVNRNITGNASKLRNNVLMSGDSNARTGMLTNYSVIHNTNHTQDEYHLHMDVKPGQVTDVRRNLRVARQLGIN